MPVTRPLRRTNQRLVTVATKARGIEPAPRPTRTPQHRMSCQLWVMNSVRKLPTAIRPSALATTARMPNRSISAAAKGDVKPYRIRLTMTAAEIVPRDHPKSSCSGSISTLGAARKLPAPMSATKAVTATSHGHSERRADARASPGAGSTTALMSPSDRRSVAGELRRRRAAALGRVLGGRLVDGVDRRLHEGVVGAEDPLVRRLRADELVLEVRHHVLGDQLVGALRLLEVGDVAAE